MGILFTCVFSFSRRMLCFYITISFQTLYKARVHQKPRNHIIHILHAYIWCTVMPIGINFLSKCLELRVHQINLWSSLPNFYYYYVHITYTKLVHKYNSITQLAFFKLERHNALPVTFQVAHNSKKNTMWHFWKIHWKKNSRWVLSVWSGSLTLSDLLKDWYELLLWTGHRKCVL